MSTSHWTNLLIVFCHTAGAPLTVFASQRPPDHAIHTKILLIKFPQAQQFVDNRLLLSPTSELWHITRIFSHANGVEPCAEAVCNAKNQIKYGMRSVCTWVHVSRNDPHVLDTRSYSLELSSAIVHQSKTKLRQKLLLNMATYVVSTMLT